MIPADAWQAFGGVIAVLIALGGAAFALQRLGLIRRAPPPSSARPDEAAALEAVRAELATLQGRLTALQEVEQRIAVLEERTRGHEEALSRIGRVHQRIDDVAASTAHIDGQLVQLNRSVGLLTEHLLSRESLS